MVTANRLLITCIIEKRGNLSLDLQVLMCRDISQALKSLHEYSIMHGN